MYRCDQGNLFKTILERLGSERFLYKLTFPRFYLCVTGWRKTQESLIYKKTADPCCSNIVFPPIFIQKGAVRTVPFKVQFAIRI